MFAYSAPFAGPRPDTLLQRKNAGFPGVRKACYIKLSSFEKCLDTG
ncbi:hypothetical protein CES86_3064 [Brucella lupini]|uniref:Uncharacterized protein n=1 Tax=Brucella lupini TaxID=255457 RepID=A0A256GMM3_9HYPH|nr:hypothetical protein CES86_3064 [Brucella lupini]